MPVYTEVFSKNNDSPTPQPYIDLSRVSLPTRVRIDAQEFEVSQLSEQQKAVLIDLSRIDKDIGMLSFRSECLRQRNQSYRSCFL